MTGGGNHRFGLEAPVTYGGFKSPWSGLATMIVVIAISDARALAAVEADSMIMDGKVVSADELRNFFRSSWCAELVSCLGLDPDAVSVWAARTLPS